MQDPCFVYIIISEAWTKAVKRPNKKLKFQKAVYTLVLKKISVKKTLIVSNARKNKSHGFINTLSYMTKTNLSLSIFSVIQISIGFYSLFLYWSVIQMFMVRVRLGAQKDV